MTLSKKQIIIIVTISLAVIGTILLLVFLLKPKSKTNASSNCPKCVNGVCVNDMCICLDGWTGTDCTTPVTPSDCPTVDGKICNSEGSCVNNLCVCNSGWSGVDCSKPSICPTVGGKVCNDEGGCVNNVCICRGGWSGVDCSIPPPTPPTPTFVGWTA